MIEERMHTPTQGQRLFNHIYNTFDYNISCAN